MKKLLFVLMVVCISSTTSLYAQQFGGRNFDPAAMKEKQKARLKETLNLTDAQADSVVNIQAEYMPKLRGMRDLQGDEKLAKLKEVNDAYKQRLTVALKDEKLVNKLIEYQEKQRKERMERMMENRRGDN